MSRNISPLLVTLFLLCAFAQVIVINSEIVYVPTVDGSFEEIDTDDVIEDDPSDGGGGYNPERDMIFLLFTQNNHNESQELIFNEPDSIRESFFDPSLPTRFTIHGWSGDGNASMNENIRDAYFELGDFNVIFVDWGAGAQTPNYVTARNRVGRTGEHLGAFIRFLCDVSGASTNDMTVIGYSLGAHVAGFAGKSLNGEYRLGAIVGLDAAGPLFSADRPDQRLDLRDALYVETIHTNTARLGIEYPIGHASFYPNFGRRQPGCGADPLGSCSHARAHRFFTEALNTEVGFYARQCRSLSDITRGSCVSAGEERRMGGEPTDTGARGVFWMPTNSRAPFAKGDSWLDRRIWSTQRWIMIISLCIGIPTLIVVLIMCYYTKDQRLRAFYCTGLPCCKKRREGKVYRPGTPEPPHPADA